MKKIMIIILFVFLFCNVQVIVAENSSKDLTVMIYMCGSNLESMSGAATADIEEILNSEYNTEAVNVILMAGGSVHWTSSYGREDHTTIIGEFIKPKGKYTF